MTAFERQSIDLAKATFAACDAVETGDAWRKPGSHYRQRGGIEPIDFIMSSGLDFCEGNVVKYVARWRFKGSPLSDLRKARWYIDRLISKAEAEAGGVEEERSHGDGNHG